MAYQVIINRYVIMFIKKHIVAAIMNRSLGAPMRRCNLLSVTALAFLLSGCNQPAVTLKAPSFQSSENTVADWNNIASKIAREMSARGLLAEAVPPSPIADAHARPVFVRVQAPDSTFLQEVGEKLADEILRSGGTVAVSPTGATVVNLDVTFVRWGPRDKPPAPLGTIAAAAAISGTIIGTSLPMSPWVAANAIGFSAAGAGILTDTIVAMTPRTNTEAVWKATIISGDRVIMKLQEPIYIREADIPLYDKATSVAPIASWNEADRRPTTRPLHYDQ